MKSEFDPQKDINDWTIKEIEDFLKLPIAETKKGYKECNHLRVLLDDENKTVTCRDCKKIIDAFWYLQLLAKEWSFRRYQDFEAIKACRSLKQQEANARARGKSYTRPANGNGMLCWDCYEALHGHPPEYVFFRGAWYAGEEGGSELFEYIQQQLTAQHDKYRLAMNDCINSVVETNKIPRYIAKMLYDDGFRNGREYEG